MNDRRYVRRLARASGSNFYYSFLFLPGAQREAIHAVYAFCRAVDDSVDQADCAEEAARQVAFWRDELAACGAPDARRPVHPITRTLAAHMGRYPIQRRHLEEIIDGVAMDVAPRRYRTFDELRDYCYHVASAVGLVCIEIFGYREVSARDYAVNLGLAFQMTNILRDVGDDARKGRVYLPLEELARFRCGEEDLKSRRLSAGFLELMRFETARARGLFSRAKSVFPVRDRRTLFAAEIMGAIYEAILDEIERRGFDVLSSRVTLSRPRKLAIATRLFLRSRLSPRAI
jgi:phytoene synthase